MIEQLQTGSPRILGFRFTGKLHDEDYRKFVPLLDAAVASEGSIRLFAQFEDFHGWDLHAAWDDFRLGMRTSSGLPWWAIANGRNGWPA